jgi:hypothetical protein
VVATPLESIQSEAARCHEFPCLVGCVLSDNVASCRLVAPQALCDGDLLLDRVGRGARLGGFLVWCERRETLDQAVASILSPRPLTAVLLSARPDKIVWVDWDIDWHEGAVDVPSMSITRPESTSAQATYVRQPSVPSVVAWAAGAAIAWIALRK